MKYSLTEEFIVTLSKLILPPFISIPSSFDELISKPSIKDS